VRSISSLSPASARVRARGRLDLVHRREVVRRQAGQGEAAAAGLHGDLVAGLRHRDLAAVGQGADDLEQLARRDRRFTVLGIVHRLAGDHFDFQVGTGQRELSAPHLHQQVVQHRQGLSPLDHVDHLREWFQEDFALQAEAHADPLNVECLPSFEWMDKSRTVVEMVSPKTGDNSPNQLIPEAFS